MKDARRQGSPPPRGRVPLRQLGPATFPADEHLRLPSTFTRVREQGRTLVGRMILMNLLPAPDGQMRLGVVSSRRFHKHAVERNRARRLLREAWRLSQSTVTAPIWLVLVARPYLLGRGAGEVQQELLSLLAKAGFPTP